MLGRHRRFPCWKVHLDTGLASDDTPAGAEWLAGDRLAELERSLTRLDAEPTAERNRRADLDQDILGRLDAASLTASVP